MTAATSTARAPTPHVMIVDPTLLDHHPTDIYLKGGIAPHLPQSSTPRILQNLNVTNHNDDHDDDDEDEDDFDRALLMNGGLFESGKRKSSRSVRKELGSPRLSTGTAAAGAGAGGVGGSDHHNHNNNTIRQAVMNFDVRKEQPQSQSQQAQAAVAVVGDYSAKNHHYIIRAVEQQNQHYSSSPSNGASSSGSGGPGGVGSSHGADGTGRSKQDKRHTAPATSTTTNVGASFLKELGSALVSCGAASTTGLGGSSSGGGRRYSSRNKGKHQHHHHHRNHHQGNNHLGPFHCAVVDDNSDLVAENWVRLKDSIHKAVRGDLDAAKEAWRRNLSESSTEEMYGEDGATLNSLGSQEDSILTYDNFHSLNPQQQAAVLQQEEEQQQLRRLTSWGTVGTYETSETSGTPDTRNSHTNNPASRATANGVLEDDDGIPIDANLLRNKSKLNNAAAKSCSKKPRRKRVVRFDYPPISSLRECPRTQPEQIGELFFTENELGQIEDDRYSTISADDVEIVAISTSTTGDSGDHGGRENDNESRGGYPGVPKSPSTPQAGSQNSPSNGGGGGGSDQFRNYISTPSKRKEPGRRRGRNFSFDDVVGWKNGAPAGGSQNATESTSSRKGSARRRRSGAHSQGNAGGSPTSSGNSKRMIKSVQIYLRERSVG